MKIMYVNEAKKKPLSETSLDELCENWVSLKEAENRAKDERLQVEAAICELVDVPTEGTNTTTTALFKCKAVGKLKRKLDARAWAEIEKDVPEHLRPVRYKAEIDLKKLKAIESANPEIWRVVAQAITSEKGKTSINIEVLP